MSRAVRYFFDTEFIERPGLLDLISIGMVDDDGREFYAVSSEFDARNADDWVKVNVLAKLGDTPRESRASIRDRLLTFIGDTKPEFWAYFSSYDWVAFCWLFGRMVDLPDGFPMFCLDFRQVMHDRGIKKSDLPKQPTDAHNALADAKWLRAAAAPYLSRLPSVQP